MNMTAVFLLSGLSVAAGVAGDQRSLSVRENREMLRKCGDEEAWVAQQPDESWIAQSDAVQKHEALRTALGEPMPAAASMILVHGKGGHLSTEEYSIVLERENAGWRGTAVGRSQIWIKDAPYRPMPRKEWMLSVKNSQRLDQILKEGCLFAEPTRIIGRHDGPPALGTMTMQLDVITPSRRRSFLLSGNEPMGRAVELLELSKPS